ncbi:MAG: phage tail family protein [Prevotella sp.]|nr:phage tail family protein [Prevotella sp.]
MKDLVFDEEPYKHWRAKVDSKPDFKYICFMDEETHQRVYKGEGSVTFICYFPYAFGFDKYVVRAADYYLLNPPECIIGREIQSNDFIHPLRAMTPEKF